MSEPYNHKAIEKKWQEYWKEHETFKTDVWDFSKPKYYALDMFPYPSGVGLHAGPCKLSLFFGFIYSCSYSNYV